MKSRRRPDGEGNSRIFVYSYIPSDRFGSNENNTRVSLSEITQFCEYTSHITGISAASIPDRWQKIDQFFQTDLKPAVHSSYRSQNDEQNPEIAEVCGREVYGYIR